MKPGEILIDPNTAPVEANAGRVTATILVQNTGDRPIQVGSHFHFFEVNRGLHFDRTAAYGMRLNIPAGTAVRFEPGDEKEISLTSLAGQRIALGCNGLVQGTLDDPAIRNQSITNLQSRGFMVEDGHRDKGHGKGSEK